MERANEAKSVGWCAEYLLLVVARSQKGGEELLGELYLKFDGLKSLNRSSSGKRRGESPSICQGHQGVGQADQLPARDVSMSICLGGQFYAVFTSH